MAAATQEDVRQLAERLIAMERAVAEQQQRAQHAKEALTALRQGQIGAGRGPQQQGAQHGIVDTKLMGKPLASMGAEARGEASSSSSPAIAARSTSG